MDKVHSDQLKQAASIIGFHSKREANTSKFIVPPYFNQYFACIRLSQDPDHLAFGIKIQIYWSQINTNENIFLKDISDTIVNPN